MKTTASLVSVLLIAGLLATAPAQDGGRSRVVPPPAGQGPGSGVQQDGDVVTILADSKGVIFSVVDERNRIVSDLKASDIEILDGGARQEIDIFRTSNDLPMMLAVLIDTSASQESLLPAEKRAVDVFLDSSFRTGKDFGAVLTFQGETTLVNGLTTNLRQLKSALGRIEREQQFRDESNATPQLGTALYDAVEITSKEVLDGKTARRVTTVRDPSAPENSRRAIRRALCILTDGKDTASQRNLSQVIARAQRLGIVIYALGMGDRFRYGEVDKDGLEKLCASSGGKAFFPTSELDLERSFKQIVDDLSGQYIAVYRPTGGTAQTDGRRVIQIRPKNPRLRVFHQTEYEPEQ